jgi:hypothetical protein
LKPIEKRCIWEGVSYSWIIASDDFDRSPGPWVQLVLLECWVGYAEKFEMLRLTRRTTISDRIR